MRYYPVDISGACIHDVSESTAKTYLFVLGCRINEILNRGATKNFQKN